MTDTQKLKLLESLIEKRLKDSWYFRSHPLLNDILNEYRTTVSLTQHEEKKAFEDKKY